MPTIAEIQRHTAEHFGIRLIDMTSRRRMRKIVRPRQVAMYLSRTLTQQSLPQIARAFHKKDHTTIMHAIRKIEELRVGERSIDLAVLVLSARLGAAR